MKLFNLKNTAVVTALSLATMLGASGLAAAQGNRGNDQRQDRVSAKQREKMQQDNARAEQARLKAEQDRIRAEQARQAEMARHNNNNGNWNGNNGNMNGNRYRVNRNGSFYNTDSRGAEMLRQAVRAGYQQGFNAGKADRNSRRGSNWNSNNSYRTGTFGYQNGVDRSQYQYYFQQGFQKGYQDGYNSRQQYGTYNNGSPNILASILGSILNIQSY